MHWIKATAPDGKASYLNLDAIPHMLEGTVDGQPATIVFFGGVGAKIDGSPLYATTAVMETIAELLALPRITASLATKILPCPQAADAAGVTIAATRDVATPTAPAPASDTTAGPAQRPAPVEVPKKGRDRFRQAKAAPRRPR
jgi:hypothetical protein